MRVLSHVAAGTAMLALLLSGRMVHAQACGGFPTFQSGPLRVGAALEWTEGIKQYGAGLAYGSHQGPFADMTLSHIDYDDADESAMAALVNAGFAVSLDKAKKVELCPILSFGYQNGPDFDVPFFGTVETSVKQYAIGAQVGGVVSSSPNVDFIPFFRAMYTSITATITLDDGTGPQSDNVSDDATILSVGAGFVLNRTFTIQPTISYPLGVEEPQAAYAIRLSVNFGMAKKAAPLRR